MWFVFEVSSGKLLFSTYKEQTANHFTKVNTQYDYLDVDEEFAHNLRTNPEWDFLMEEV